MQLIALLVLLVEPPDLSLIDAIARALVANRGLLRSQLNLDNAITRTQLEMSDFQWQLSSAVDVAGGDSDSGTLSLSAAKKLRAGTDISLSSFTDLDKSETSTRFETDYRLTVSQPLTVGAGRLSNETQLRNARRFQTDTQVRHRGNAQNLVLNVVRTYYQVLFQQKTILFSEKSLERLEGLLEATEIKLKIGRVSQVDLYRVRLLRNRTSLDLARAHTDLERLRRNLADLVGMATREAFQPVTPAIPIPLSEDLEIATLLEDVTRQIGYGVLQRQLAESRIDLTLARRSLWPDLSLNLNFFVDRVPELTSLSGADDPGYSISLSQRYQHNRKRARANVVFAENQLKQEDLGLTDFRREFERGVLDRVRNLGFVEQQVALNRESLLFSEQQLEVARIRFERGLIDNFDVIEAEENVLSAANAMERAERDLVLGWLGLKIYLNRLEPDQVTLANLLQL